MFFSWNAFLTAWLFSFTRIGVNFGRVEYCDEGSMNASATDVLRGSTVTLSCLINRTVLGHVRDTHKIAIFQNGSEVSRSYGYSVNAHVLMHTFGLQTFECKSAVRVSGLLICGIYIHVGVPPDQPKNVSCIQYGKNGTMTCTWKEGSYTYFNTVYELQLTNGITNDTQLLRKNTTYDTVALVAKLDFDSTYTAVVNASNELGNAVSLPFQFTLSDIGKSCPNEENLCVEGPSAPHSSLECKGFVSVKPHSLLDISVKCDGFDGTNCTVFWQDQQDTQLFRIRFRPVNSNSWIMLENITARRYDLHDLKPDTKYEFQVSSRFFPSKGLWSDWSKSLQTADIPKATPPTLSIKNVQAGAAYILWMTASTEAEESPKGNESLAFTDEPGWAPVVVFCIVGLSMVACCAMCARLQGFSLISVHISGWYKAVPDPANSSWAKKFTSVESELSSYSSQFLHNLDNLEEPETLQIEEVLITRQSPGFEDMLFSERREKRESHTWPAVVTQEENPTMDKSNHHPMISDTLDQHQLLFLYKKVAHEEANQGQVFSDYLVNPLEDTTVDYLPSTILPTITDTAEDSSEAEFSSFNIFSRTFQPQTFSLGGKLTLDAIRMDCNSFMD